VYTAQTIENVSVIKRFSHSARFENALSLLAAGEGDRLLDYGTGDGHFLGLVADRGSPVRSIVGYEPLDDEYERLAASVAKRNDPRISVRKTLAAANESFERVTCLEVLEHIPPPHRLKMLIEIRSLLTPDGRAVLSVPVEIGLNGLAKNLIRLAIGQVHDGTTLANLARLTLGMPINRPPGESIATHIGFDYRDLEREFAPADLVVTRRMFSPFPALRGAICSQVFYVLRRGAVVDHPPPPD
jgi:SAM-dependent methyltransferase